MNPQTTPQPEQQPVVPIAEIPIAPEVAVPTNAPVIPAAIPANTPLNASAPLSTAVTNESVAVAPADINPTIAEDVDVIEKEWVDKAEAVIMKTAGDPHAEEEQIEDLQIDYMKKRYGIDIAKSGDPE